MINVIEYLEESAKRFPDRIAFGDPAETVTFSQLEKNARAIGSYLLKNGIRQCDAVAFYMEKSVKAATVMLGAVYANAFYSFIDIRQTPNRTLSILDRLEPFVIITDDENIDQIAGIIDDPSKIVKIEELFDKALSAGEDEALLEKARSFFYRHTDTVCQLYERKHRSTKRCCGIAQIGDRFHRTADLHFRDR